METIKCYNCEKPVVKEKRELTRQRKRGRYKFYCGLSYSATKSNLDNPRAGNMDNLISGNRRDEYTQFRFFTTKKKGRINRVISIDEAYLTVLWKQQDGKCPFTGWDLLLPDHVEGWKTGNTIKSASLDRIDNAIDYAENNVRFISVMANYARNTFTDEQVIDFCHATTNYHSSPNIIANDIIQPPSEESMRWFLKCAKQRKNKGECNLDLTYLANVWIKQSGRCVLSGQKLILPMKRGGITIECWPQGHFPINASLDRIDNSLGYVQGNVRFIGVMANYGRATFTDLEFIEFCEAVANHHPTKLNEFK
jgi:hypothetical protein